VRAGGSCLPFGSLLSRAIYHLELPAGTPGVHEVEHNLEPLAALGIAVQRRPPHLVPSSAATQHARAFLERDVQGAGPLVIAHVGAGKLPNIWPSQNFASVLQALQRERGARVVLSEGPRDAAHVDAVAARLGGAARWRAPLGDTIGLLSLTDLVISNDTGMAHVAAATGVPTIVIFGPTDPQRWAPPGAHVHVVRSRTGFVADVAAEEVLHAARRALDAHPTTVPQEPRRIFEEPLS
jgi:ADP-heptose:LPS heptosyltransferase